MKVSVDMLTEFKQMIVEMSAERGALLTQLAEQNAINKGLRAALDAIEAGSEEGHGHEHAEVDLVPEPVKSAAGNGKKQRVPGPPTPPSLENYPKPMG